jgi:hypothetical protein
MEYSNQEVYMTQRRLAKFLHSLPCSAEVKMGEATPPITDMSS